MAAKFSPAHQGAGQLLVLSAGGRGDSPPTSPLKQLVRRKFSASVLEDGLHVVFSKRGDCHKGVAPEVARNQRRVINI